MNDNRWILAFDSSCAKCRRISEIVTEVAGHRLDTRPLADPEVVRWRHESLGSTAAWQPTLLRVADTGVRGWTGAALTVPLVRLLGLRAGLAVLRALGEFARSEAAAERPVAVGHSRRGALLVGTSAVFFGAMMLSRGSGSAEAATIDRWLQANLSSLPRELDEISRYPVEYRRAMVLQLPAEVQSRLWTEHLAKARVAHDRLSPAQDAALRAVEDLMADPNAFRSDQSVELSVRLDTASERMLAEFGAAQARKIVGVLGPDTAAIGLAAVSAAPKCNCSTSSNFCDRGCIGTVPSCNRGRGCGIGWTRTCNGRCG